MTTNPESTTAEYLYYTKWWKKHGVIQVRRTDKGYITASLPNIFLFGFPMPKSEWSYFHKTKEDAEIGIERLRRGGITSLERQIFLLKQHEIKYTPYQTDNQPF